MGTTHFSGLNLKTAVIDGGAAGDHTVTGIELGSGGSQPSNPGDSLVAVIHISGDGTQLTGGEDLTSEFSITADDTINNGGGTATTNGILIVFYLDANA